MSETSVRKWEIEVYLFGMNDENAETIGPVPKTQTDISVQWEAKV